MCFHISHQLRKHFGFELRCVVHTELFAGARCVELGSPCPIETPFMAKRRAQRRLWILESFGARFRRPRASSQSDVEHTGRLKPWPMFAGGNLLQKTEVGKQLKFKAVVKFGRVHRPTAGFVIHDDTQPGGALALTHVYAIDAPAENQLTVATEWQSPARQWRFS